MFSTHILRWGVPLLLTGVLPALLSRQSPGGEILGRYSLQLLVLIVTTGCLAAACWWVALGDARYRRLLDRASTLIGLGFCLACGVALVDLFTDSTPVVAWLPLPMALALLWLGRGESKSRLSEPVGIAALVLGATLLGVLAAEIVFRTVLVDNYVPSDDAQFERMIAVDWPRPVPRQRTPGTFRILHLGDSFGKAGGRRNFQYVLEELLEDTGIDVEILDFSRPGYEPLEQLALLRRFGEAFQPDVVLHGFFVGNDFETPRELLRIYEGLILRPAPGLQALRPHNFLLRRWLHQYIAVIRNNRQKAAEGSAGKTADRDRESTARSPVVPAAAAAAADENRLTPGKAHKASGPGAKQKTKEKSPGAGTMSQAEFLRVEKYRLGFYAPGPPPEIRWQETARLLAEIRAEVERIGSDYLMVIHPDQLQVEPEVVDALVKRYQLDLSGYDLRLPQDFLLGLCDGHGVSCVDLLPTFQASAEPLYLVRDTHYNRDGNRLAAETILAKLTETGALRPRVARKAAEWRSYLGDRASNQYSPLTQIGRDNVPLLEEAWRYDPGDGDAYGTLIPTNPLVVNGVLYGLSARKNLFALDAATGRELWVYPFDQPHGGKGAGRGLVHWEGTTEDGRQANWVLVGLGHTLYAVDARSGELVEAFGENGAVDLRVGLDRPVEDVNLSVIAPGTLYGDLLIQGFGTSEFYDAAPGYIRAYRLPGGELHWTFRTIPAPGETGADTWPVEGRERFGGANSWAGITVDAERGIAFVPTGSAAYDYYGANREGDNLFANSLVALDADTGERLWHYQFVRHDLWDRDLPTPPNLVTVERDGEAIPAVSQATKSGHLFLFHRDTGELLVPVEEVPVTGSGAPGSHPAASQPLPTAPPPFASQHFELTTVRPESTAYVGALIEGMTTNRPFHAPDERGLVIYPGLDGGAEWGGQAYDAQANRLFINTNEVPWYITMVPQREREGSPYTLEFGYMHYCGGCHGADREGHGDIFPSLKNIGDRYWPWEVWDIVRNGRGRMPAFAGEPWSHLSAALLYLYTADENEIAERRASGEVASYLTDGFNTLTDEFGLPGSQPPWGSLVAIDLDNTDIAWKIPLGDYPRALELGLSGLGSENYGGPVVTAGGLLFIAATPDSKLRAFDTDDGSLLWETTLPAAGFATPAVYEAAGRQFVVIAAGGGKLGQPSGSAYVAYALPAPASSAATP